MIFWDPSLINIYGSGHGPSAVMYHALRKFFRAIEIADPELEYQQSYLKMGE